jgi:DNA-directed RNA polymerase specialized sigma24 family protein
LYEITRHRVLQLLQGLSPGGKGVGGTDVNQRLREVPDADGATDPAATDPTPPPEPGPTDPGTESKVKRRAFELILQQFEDQTRNIVVEVVVNRRRPADVAEDLGITRNAVYQAKSHALRRIREEYQGMFED